jgi:uncharacterized protein YbjT (DUF2867 family)
MTSRKHVLVTGATGQQGGAVTQALMKKGHRVRGLTRRPDSRAAQDLAAQGVEIAAGDFASKESLVRAASGVDTIFAMTTPFEQGVAAETAQGIVLIDAATQAGVGHLVYSSVAGADRQTGVPHFDSKFAVEEAIVTSGVPYTIIAPVFFMDNLLQPWMSGTLKDGQLSMAMPGARPLQQISVANIGAFAAAVIERREAAFGRRIDIAGDELSNNSLAAIFADVLGHEVQYGGFPPDAMRAQSEDMALMFEWFDAVGYSADIDGLRRDFPEVAWQRADEWVRAQDWEAILGVTAT